MTTLTLIDESGGRRCVEANPAPAFAKPKAPLRSRTVYAAAHVVPLAWADNTPGRPAQIDWESTIGFRRMIWSWGLGVADCMDTAQRNLGLDWPATAELMRRTGAAAAQYAKNEGWGRSVADLVCAGVNTDQLEPADLGDFDLSQIVEAYLQQLSVCEQSGCGPVIMCSRHLCQAAKSAADYVKVYDEVISAAKSPVILHWLGEVFDNQLHGYFGSTDWRKASQTLLRIIADNPGKVRGVKMSLLDEDAERYVRAMLPEGVMMLTGDDMHYVDLIRDGEQDDPRAKRQPDNKIVMHSDALLGAFSVIAPHVSAAVQALDRGDEAAYLRILEPTQALARQVFAAPTEYYKTSVAFMSWLNGHQPAFAMVGGLQSARSLPSLSRVVQLANECGALEVPQLAAQRWNALLALNGIGMHGV
ncbi:DUF993 family protein [Bifidobacterium sp. ESL0745]|uniref:DUF993 family protein n=1 Tax=Bifidobacterium sp. ESL0745 TaxID=2983226 RepID=UPI0023F92FC2|nr:DUF993 family protein [Bifidobacterium sp. ESL0745]MDF7664670.1 DUF993 family protein [Bifidobacterium sp. ESL0745]